MSLREWFGLRRDNYFLDPRDNPEDRKFYAKRPNSLVIENQITSLEIDLVANLFPKKLYWGPYGSGKTHTLYKVLYELEKQLRIHVAFVECPVLKKNSTFVQLYAKTLEILGMEFIMDLLHNAMSKAVEKAGGFQDAKIVEKELMVLMRDEDLGRASYRTITQQLDPIKIWRWITGAGVSAKEKDELSVRDELETADPTRLVGILITIGKLMKLLREKQLVIVYDELDRTKQLGPETTVTFSTAFTRLTEPSQTDVAVFFSLSASRLDDLPDILTEPVRNRIGKENLVEIPPMTSGDIKPFVSGIVGYVRDSNFKAEELINKYSNETEEKLSPDLYPFTESSLESIKSACGQLIVPRDICRFMSKAAAFAKIRKKHVVTTKDVDSAAATGAQQ